MANGDLNWIANFIWGIADDVLRDVYVRGKCRDVILPMVVIRRLDAVLEPTKQAVLDMKANLDKARITKSASVVRDLELDLTSLQSQIELTQGDIQSNLRVDYQRVVGPLQEKLLQVVNEYGRNEGFTIILRRAGPTLVYAREALDITEPVIKLFNKKS